MHLQEDNNVKYNKLNKLKYCKRSIQKLISQNKNINNSNRRRNRWRGVTWLVYSNHEALWLADQSTDI